MQHAAHEAGHYTTARLLRKLYPGQIRKVRVWSLTVVKTAEAGGAVNAKFSFPKDRLPVWVDTSLPLAHKVPRLVHLLAGIAGESLWLYLYGEHKLEEGVWDLGPGLREILDNVENLAETGGKADVQQATSLIGSADWEPHFMTALGLVHQHWPAVHRVAKALVAKRTLRAKEAHVAFIGLPDYPPERRTSA